MVLKKVSIFITLGNRPPKDFLIIMHEKSNHSLIQYRNKINEGRI